MRRKEIISGVGFFFNIAVPIATTLLAWLNKTGHVDLLSSNDGSWSMARGTEKGLFDHLNGHPMELASFAAHMSGYSEDRGIWFDIYPVGGILEGCDDSTPLLVDVGGGRGHDMDSSRFRDFAIRGSTWARSSTGH